MTTTNIIVSVFFFFFILILITIYKKHTTYKGICTVSILNNIKLFYVISKNWEDYVINEKKELFTLNINNNTWAGYNSSLTLQIDQTSFIFLILVSFIGFLTNIYILSYFKYEQRAEEFILLINWFILGMMVFLMSENFISIILGWECIGLSSFFLINFWVDKTSTINSSIKAFTFNKISDIFILVGLINFWHIYQIDNISSIRYVGSTIDNTYSLEFGCLCLIIGCFVKSAQFIFHLWLPDSMEAPVPASALIHSATLVSAGIYLILKFYFMVDICSLSSFLFYWGSITGFYGGLVAAHQTDLKKILAYSTISHCGFLVVSIVFNNWTITFTYLFLHGIYKASVFFCAGFFIKYFSSQDNRLMGKSKGILLLKIFLIFTVINLSGLPFTWGYLYKNLFFQGFTLLEYNVFFCSFLILGMLTSIVYCFKILKFTLFDNKNNNNFLELLLQNNTYRKLKYNNFVLSNGLCITIVYVFSFYFYFFINNFFWETGIDVCVNNSSPNISAAPIFYKLGIKYLIYYFLFLLIVYLIVFILCRINISFRINYFYFFIIMSAIFAHLIYSFLRFFFFW